MTRSVTFPHLGEYAVGFEHFFRALGYRVVLPPPNSHETLSLGARVAPSQACLPFKYTLGNILQVLQQQPVDTVGMLGGRTGICRLSYYGELYRVLLDDLGQEVELFPFRFRRDMWHSIQRHFPGTRASDVVAALGVMFAKLRLVELIREGALETRPFEVERGTCHRVQQRLVADLARTDDLPSLWRFPEQIRAAYQAVDQDRGRSALVFGLVGELFLVLDRAASLNLEVLLGELGVVVRPSISLTGFLWGSLPGIRSLTPLIPSSERRVQRLARPFLNRSVGGHGWESVGETALMAERGFDGVIHLYPFTCMPEVVAASLLPDVSRRHAVPVLSLCFDEHTGAVGLETRLEAFVDLVRRRRRRDRQRPTHIFDSIPAGF